MVIDIHRSVCEIGDYAMADVDDDGRPEILEIDPIYGTVIDPTYGTEVYECHFCPHQYEVAVLEFAGVHSSRTARVNGGRAVRDVTEVRAVCRGYAGRLLPGGAGCLGTQPCPVFFSYALWVAGSAMTTGVQE